MGSAQFNLTAGLHTGPGEAGPDHCVAAQNFYSHQGRIKARLGTVPLEAVSGKPSTPYIGTAAHNAEPAAVVNAGTVTAATLDDAIFIGHSAQFNRAIVYGKSIVSTNYALQSDPLRWDYWNGTAWTQFYPGQIWKPVYNTTYDIWTQFPYVANEFAAALQTITDNHINIVMDPDAQMSDWATKTIAGQTKYWIRVSGWINVNSLAGLDGATMVLASSSVNATENQVVGLLAWRDRAGATHRFVAHLYGDDRTTIKFTLDGTVLTPSVDLTPTNSAKVFDPATEVVAFYHAATNRVIGVISSLCWFYCIPGNGQIYVLTPDPVGTDTPYQSLVAGLRAAIPLSTLTTLFDGRVFIAKGQSLFWSSPGVYPDIWPNANELDLQDSYGDITGLGVVNGTLTVWKRNIIYSIQSDGSADGYDAVPLTANIGAVGPGMVTTGDMACFVAETGMYTFDGKNVMRVSSAIDESFLVRSIGSDLSKVRSVFHGPLNQWRMFFPSVNESTVKDAALYVDLTGYTEESQGEEKKTISIWPQGRVNTTDYGFNMTAVAEDSTQQYRRILCGDRFGVVWEMDQGLTDAGTDIWAYIVQAPMNVGGSKKMLVQWMSVTVRDTGKIPFLARIIPSGFNDSTHYRQCTLNAHKTQDASIWGTGTVLQSGDIQNDYPNLVLRQANIGVQCQMFQAAIYKQTAGELEVVGVEIEARGLGGRAEAA